MKTETGTTYRLEDYRPTDYAIPELRLLFRLDPKRTEVTATLSLERRAETAAGTPLVLDGDGLDLTGIEIDGRALGAGEYEATPDRLTVTAPPAAPFVLTLRTIVDPAANTALMGLYRSGGNYCTQCEAEGFRRITYFLDRPDVLSVYSVRIEARRDEAPVLLSNGNPGATGDLGNGWHFAEWHDPFPKPSYLFALVAGDLGHVADRYITRSGREVALAIHVQKGKEARAAYAMDALKRSMAWDEERFGREYEHDVFNIVAVPDFNMGAMENTGLNVFNDKYILADPETATDVDYANIEAIVAHEYFHNWTGNRITCRDWFQLCLKEGLTVFRDHEFSADQRSRAVRRIQEVRTLKTHQFPEDAGPLAHPVRPRRYREINNFYTATVYEKGSEVVRMIRTILGEDGFRRGMDLYFERHDGQAVTIEDFLAAFEDATGQDLGQFALWYHQAGTPHVAVTSAYDAETRRFTVEIEQSLAPTPGEKRKRLMHIPLAFGLIGEDGEELAWQGIEGAHVSDGVLHVTRRRHRVVFTGVMARPVLSLNRGFSAPVTLSMTRSQDERLFLARHDSDLVARWLELTEATSAELVAAARRIRDGKDYRFSDALVALFGEIAGDETLEPAYRALALTLPSEGDIAREMGSGIDPDAILAARDGLQRRIADENREALERTFTTTRDALRAQPFSADGESAGRRALVNSLLAILSMDTPERAVTHYDEAGNMTDRMAGLTVLAHRFPGSKVAKRALADFEQRFRDDPVVFDKWFQVQATAPGADSADTVRRLAEHPAFSLTNPNRVRALYGAFSAANPTGFHRPDGAGYALFADTVLALEQINPQVAARLATALHSWRSLEPKRRELARQALERIAAEGVGTPDLSDIVERTLA